VKQAVAGEVFELKGFRPHTSSNAAEEQNRIHPQLDWLNRSSPLASSAREKPSRVAEEVFEGEKASGHIPPTTPRKKSHPQACPVKTGQVSASSAREKAVPSSGELFEVEKGSGHTRQQRREEIRKNPSQNSTG
jgi:hypothetical protein